MYENPSLAPGDQIKCEREAVQAFRECRQKCPE